MPSRTLRGLTAAALAVALIAPLSAAVRPQHAAAATAASQQPAVPPTPIVANTQVTAGNGPSGSPTSPPVTDGPTGPVGDFTASSLGPEGSWSAGGNDGSFSWSYPVKLPPAASGSAAPDIALSYSSASVDGETGTTNNQSSWIGQGWDYDPGFIERTYRTCADDTTLASADQTGDMCWAGQILTYSLKGKSTSIVQDAGGSFHLQSDDGTRIARVTDGTSGNGALNGEYWKVTTTDGTQYYFGQNKVPGGTTPTDSVFTEPVYGAHPNDPCNSSAGFASSACTQGWRWNLDYVVDVHGNATVYYYDQETNYYTPDNGQNNAKPVQYVRGGYLDHIDYGLRLENGTVYGSKAPDQVAFSVAERCFANSSFSCDPAKFTAANASYWPDTPQNLQCLSASATCSSASPSMWTMKRLTTITTQIWNAGTGKYQPVDSYALTQAFPSSADEELTLSSIVHTGYDATGANPLAEPPVTFEGQLYDNRIPGYNKLPGLAHWRMYNIATETGETISVTYNTPQCTASNLPPATDTAAQQAAFASTNTMNCFPVYWTPPGYTAPIFDYFTKYTVASVQVSDPNALSPKQITHYYYLGGAAWHYDDNELVKPSRRTYGQFRGYAQVETTTGDTGHTSNGAADGLTLTEKTYFRGMDQDTLPNNGTRSVSVPDTFGGQMTDTDAYAGRVYEAQTFDGATLGSNGLPAAGAEISATLTKPEIVATTATRTRSGLPSLLAQIVETSSSTSYTDLAAGGTDSSQTSNSYDSLGRVVASQSSGTKVPAVCTTTAYADNTSNWVRDKVSETIVAGQSCPSPVGSALTAADVLGDTRNYYDASTTLGALPGAGDLTRTDIASADTGGTLTWITDDTRATYDASGRTLTATDALGHVTTTAYTPADGGSLTQKTVTNPICAVSSSLVGCATITTFLDPGRGVVTKSIDASGHKTSAQYDALGRITAVWTPGFVQGLAQATTTYSYVERNNGPQAVTTNTLVDDGAATNNLNYRASVTLSDAMGQKLQVQSVGENGSMLATDTKYDSHGWVVDSNNQYATNGTPSSTLISVADAAVNSRTQTAYDGVGRSTLVTQYNGTTATSAAQTVYGGDRVSHIGRKADGTTFDPGVTAATTITDVRGKTVELDQYTGAPTVAGDVVSGPATGTIPGTPGTLATTYTLDALGEQTVVKDSAGDQWTRTYDLLGRITQRVDPDSGKSTTAYDDDGNITSTTDANGSTLSYQYDPLNRKTGQFTTLTQNSGTQTAAWLWDTEQRGKLTSTSTMNVKLADGTTGTFVNQVNGYDDAGRPGGWIVTVPAGETGLAGTYTATTANTSTGLITSDTPAALPGSPNETVKMTYDALGDTTSAAGYNAYLSAVSYTPYGEAAQETLGASNAPVWLTYTYTPQTRRVAETNVSAQIALPQLDDTKYTFDADQRNTAVTDAQGYGSTAPVEQQCFAYDALNRLTEAYTAAQPTSDGSCPTDPAAAGRTAVGGPQPYWTTWTFDQLGQRQSQDQHALTSQGTDAATTYAYGQTGHAHALSGVTTSGTSGTQNLTGYVYDNAGNVTTYPSAGSAGTQTLTWSPQGRLLTDTTASGDSTTQVNDADGNQLVTRDSATNTDTLYLSGEQLAYNTKTGVATGTRSYMFGKTEVALRVGGGNPQYVVSDPHSTGLVTVDSVTMNVVRRTLDPYGGQIGATAGGTWPDQRGFLNKPQDPATGLADVGARQYDPATGRFLTLDAAFEAGSPEQLNGYTYAGNDPVNVSDPSGNWFLRCANEVSCALPAPPPSPPTTSTSSSSSSSSSDSSSSSSGSGNGSTAPTVKKTSQPSPLLCGANTFGYLSCAGPIGNTTCPAGFVFSVNSCLPTFATTQDGGCIFGHNQNGRCNGDGVPSYLWQHIYVQASVCVVVCASVGVQGGILSFSVSGVNWSGPSETPKDMLSGFAGVQIGWSGRPASGTTTGYLGGCYAEGVGGCAGATIDRSAKNDDGAHVEPYVSVGLGAGLSIGGGPEYSWETNLMPSPTKHDCIMVHGTCA